MIWLRRPRSAVRLYSTKSPSPSVGPATHRLTLTADVYPQAGRLMPNLQVWSPAGRGRNPTMQNMVDYSVSASPDARTLVVRGELDISTSASLRNNIDDALDSGARRVEIDLSGVVFMDSSALSTLVGARERAAGRGQTLSLLRPSPACSKVLGITGLDRVFDLR